MGMTSKTDRRSLLRARHENLLVFLRREKKILVAYSGGCDSSFLLAAARRELGKEAVLAITAVSPSLAEREKTLAEDLARRLDVHHYFLETREMDNPSYVANPSNRCFYCKDELFGKLEPIAKEHRMTLVDGFNASDRSDIRPGLQAAHARSVQHPLDEADLTKRDIRVLSRWMGLLTWNKPASPCLSSRIPYGTPVTEKILKQIEKAELVVRSEGFSVVRVRHYGAQARIEVPEAELPRLKMSDCWKRVECGVKAIGYEEVIADPRGFLSGRLNVTMSFPNIIVRRL
jgi:uncharacterized protein